MNHVLTIDNTKPKVMNQATFNALWVAHITPVLLEQLDVLRETQFWAGNVKKFGRPFSLALDKDLNHLLSKAVDIDSEAYQEQNNAMHDFLSALFNLNPETAIQIFMLVKHISDGRIKTITIEENDD